MKVFHFTEQAYSPAWNDHEGSLRVVLPNRKMDPAVASDLFHRFYDEWQLADELGYDIMVNEHHATATCMSSTVIVTLSILARETKRARLLVLGYPIGHRPDPLRCAEELATIDVVSRGRLEMGFVKGVPYEIHPSNSNPATLSARFWEAHDFILKAMTSHDGPFTWEGEFFHYRNVNIWPRPWQQPHPPVWISCVSLPSVPPIASRGHVLGTVMSGYTAKNLFGEYRRVWREAGHDGPFPTDRLCYAGFLGVGDTEAEGRRRGDLVAQYLRTNSIVGEAYRNPPGFVAPAAAAKMLKASGGVSFQSHQVATKDGKPLGSFAKAGIQDLIDGGLLFAGTPDQVYDQIVDFYETVGGFDHLQLMSQAGTMGFADTAANITLFAKEVMPRLNDYAARRRKEAGLPAMA